LARWWCRRYRFPRLLRLVERVSKSILFDCRDCGDCSLFETAYLCPESQCVKNQRNGPCGGSRDLLCEVTDTECIWSRAYRRLKSENRASDLLTHAPVLQNQALRRTSSWVNAWLGKDHASHQ
ncbi:MAG: methylenetetrahydrofolate reductase C-terminal domain-containing protein, partial [bacterium]|nr:methylenetetrahydrofolate reductase C-terminal domain-containing protein [bacterium]